MIGQCLIWSDNCALTNSIHYVSNGGDDVAQKTRWPYS